MPLVDAAPDVALLRMPPLHVRRTVSQNEALPAKRTPLGILVVTLLGRASLALEARQERRVRDPQTGAESGDSLVLTQLEDLCSGRPRRARQKVIRRVGAAAAVRLSQLGSGRVLGQERGDQRLFLCRVHGFHQLGLALPVRLFEKHVGLEGVTRHHATVL